MTSTSTAAERLRPGVWSVLATPFQGSAYDLCEASLVREVEHYTAAGVTGLVVLGVLGEGAALTLAEQGEIVEIVTGTTDLPVVVGLPGLGTHVAIEQALTVTAAAVRPPAALMVQVNSADVVGLGKHLRAVASAAGTGLVVQDHPAASGVTIDPGSLARVLTDVSDVVCAVKAEGPPTPAAIAALTARLDVPVFGGLGGVGLLDELAVGAAGAMTGFAFPEALVATVSAHQAHGAEAARAALLEWLPMINFEAQPRISLAIRKEILRTRGLFIESSVRPPAPSLPEALLPVLVDYVRRADALVGV